MSRNIYNRILTLEIIRDEIKPYGIQLISKEYHGNKIPLHLKCSCGELFQRKHNKFKRDGYLCNQCKKRLRVEKELSILIDKFKDLECDYISHEEYKNQKTIFKFKCSCGVIASKKIVYIIKNPYCEDCIRERINKNKNLTNDEVKEIIETNSNCKLISTDYINRDSEMVLLCSCGNEFITYLPRFQYENKRQCNTCGIEKRSGENSYRWKGGTTSEYDKIRKSKKYITWRNLTFKRDDFTCQCCNDSKGGNLHAHHILNFSEFEDLRFEVSNAITICNSCHNPSIVGSFHHKYGTRNNTLEQLQEYFNMKRTELNLPLVSIEEIIYKDNNTETKELQTN